MDSQTELSDVPADPLVGKLLSDRYRIDKLLGEGGMGRVYAAEHILMRKRVAVKILHRELTRMPDVVSRFEREAMAAANIEHPNVATATDFGHLPDGSLFLVLEYVQGSGLRSEIERSPMPIERALHIARQIVSALGAAHARGIVHRDLKPENVMLVDRGPENDFVKVLDFGIAKVPIQEISERGSVRPGQVITKVGMVFGTPEYMAPEQALGQDVDGRSDLYGVGIMLFEMLSQVRPFVAPTAVALLARQLQNQCPKVAERNPLVDVPPEVDALLARLLVAEREQRFQTAEEVMVAIDRVLTDCRSWLEEGAAAEAPAMAPTLPAPPLDLPLPRFSNGLSTMLERARAALPRPIRRRLRDVPTPMLALFGGVTALLLVGGATIVLLWSSDHPGSAVARRAEALPAPSSLSSVELRAPTGSQTIPPQPSHASEAELVLARSSQLASVQRLADRYPRDSRVILELAQARFRNRDAAGAVGEVARALVLEPTAVRSAEVASLLWKTAQKAESAEATFTLLEGPMGERGADILYDLRQTEQLPRDTRERAARYFSERHYVDRASPALAVLVELGAAQTCEERHRLLERVVRDADARVLPVLEALEKTTGCGANGAVDCNPCLRADDRLSNAVGILRKRNPK